MKQELPLTTSFRSIAATPRDWPLIALAAAQTAIFAIPLVVLGQAIGWPGSLRLPAAEILPLIAKNPIAVQVGYWSYLLVSLALIPLALALRLHAHAKGLQGLLVDTATALGIAAGVLKMLGIVRWLIAMPGLSEMHGTTTDPAMRAAIEVSYTALNGYAGAVGELLGVQLASGLFLVLTGLILIRTDRTLIGWGGVVIGALFVATCIRTLVPAFAMIQSVAVLLALLWFPALAFSVWRKT
jgi:hypothetical protein